MALTRLLRFQELPSFRHLAFFNVFRVQLHCTKIFENSSVRLEVGLSWCNEFEFGFGISMLLLDVGEVEFHLSKHKRNVLALPEQSFQYLYCLPCWRNKMQNADLHDMGYSLSSPKCCHRYRVIVLLHACALISDTLVLTPESFCQIQ